MEEAKMKNKIKTLKIVLFYGGLWGILEATLGYFLHLLPPGIAGILMFPIAFYFMNKSYHAADKSSVIFYTASVAALIKLVDLLIPFTPPIKVLNPALAILLQALVVFVFLRQYKENRIYARSFTSSFSWIILFVASQRLITRPIQGLYQQPFLSMLRTIMLNGIGCGILIGTYLKLKTIHSLGLSIHKFSWARSLLVVVFALFCELGNSILF